MKKALTSAAKQMPGKRRQREGNTRKSSMTILPQQKKEYKGVVKWITTLPS
jgi:hypothetical protein